MKRRCHPNSLALILGALLAVGGCATADDYRTTQRQVEGQGAELKTQIRQLEEKVMSTMNGRMERDRRDLEGRLESQSAQVSAWIETEDKKLNGRFDEKVGRTQEALNTFGKRMDERFDAQDRAVKKIEADGRATSARNADIDKALAQVTETVRSVGAKLSQQVEQQSGSLGRLDETSKQTDAQLKALSGRVTQFQATLAEFSKVAHALNEKAGETGRQSEDKLSALAKRVELDGQAMTTHLNAVTQNVTALTKTVDNTVATVNETTRVVGDLKRAVEVSVGKLASRVDEQGEVLNQVVQRMQNGKAPATSQSEPVDPPRSPVVAAPKPDGSRAAEAVYEQAHTEYTQGRYDDALSSFQNFLVQYPDSTLAPNAHFWIAESYVRKRDYSRSLESYEQVIKNYPKSVKASSALYRKALVLLEMNDKTAAKNVLRQILSDYPKSEESKQARNKLASIQ